MGAPEGEEGVEQAGEIEAAVRSEPSGGDLRERVARTAREDAGDDLAVDGMCPLPGQVCPVPFGCCNGNAVCGSSGTWEYQSVACAEACIPCSGGLSCNGAAICVDYQADSNESFGCRQEPCPGASDCGCAKSICDEASLSCQSYSAGLPICDCPTC